MSMRSLHIFNCGVEFFDRMNAWKVHVGHTIDTKMRMVTAFGLLSVPLDSSIGLDERKVDSVGLLEAGVRDTCRLGARYMQKDPAKININIDLGVVVPMFRQVSTTNVFQRGASFL
jgi:hypothetical protein